jgi:hypothetical protein
VSTHAVGAEGTSQCQEISSTSRGLSLHVMHFRRDSKNRGVSSQCNLLSANLLQVVPSDQIVFTAQMHHPLRSQLREQQRHALDKRPH